MNCSSPQSHVSCSQVDWNNFSMPDCKVNGSGSDRLALYVPASILLAILTLGSNGLLLYVFCRNPRLYLKRPYWFMASLAVADFLIGILILPLLATYSHFDYWPFPMFLCEVWSASDVFACTASILNICLIGIDRYWAIRGPTAYAHMRPLKYVAGMLISAWVLSFFVALPPILGWRASRGGLNCCNLRQDAPYVLFSTLFSFFIPVTVIILVYCQIFVVTQKRSRTMRRKISSRQRSLSIQGLPNTPESSVNGFLRRTKSTMARRKLTDASFHRMPSCKQSLCNSDSGYSRLSRLSCKMPSRGSKSNTSEDGVLIPHFSFGSIRGHEISNASCPDTPQSEVQRSILRSRRFRSKTEKRRRSSGKSDISPRPKLSFTVTPVSSEMEYPRVHRSHKPLARGGTKSCAAVGGSLDMSVDNSNSITLSTERGGALADAFKMTQFISVSTWLLGTASDEDSVINLELKDEVFDQTPAGSPLSAAIERSGLSGENHVALRERLSKRLDRLKHRERQSAVLLGTIVFAFVVCWAPFFVCYVIQSLFYTLNADLLKAVAFLGYCNSALNPLMYGFINADCRLAYEETLCGRKRKMSTDFGRKQSIAQV